MKESLAGKDICLNCIFYEDENDSSFYLPGRYATVPETTDCLQEISRAGRGRFHWYRTNGKEFVVFHPNRPSTEPY